MIPTLEQAKTWNQLRGQIFCNNMRRATVVLVPQALLLYMAWGGAPGWLLAALAVSIVLLHAWRLIIIRRGSKLDATDRQWDELCASISRISAFHGVWIGLSAALLMPLAPGNWAIGIAIIVLGIQAGSIATVSVYPPSFWGFAIPIFIGFSVGWYRIHPELIFVIAPLFLLFLLVLHGAVRNFYDVLKQSWELRSERNRALANAEEANRQKTRFLAAAGHDLRQPTAALGFMAEELIERDLPTEIQPIANNIRRSSENIRVLLDKLFDLSRLDTPLISNSPKWVALADLADTLRATVEARAGAKGLQFSVETTEGYLWADPAHLQRLLSNLLDNSLKYTDKGSIKLTISKTSDSLQVSVTDTGRGIAADQLEQVWAERIQGSDSSAEQAEFSLGLGLSIVRRLGQVLRAKTNIKSALGEGTTVDVFFPLAAYAQTVEATGKSVEPTNRFDSAQGKRLLLVEDNPDVRDALSRHLQRLGFEVDVAAEASTARKMLSATSGYNLMVTDYRLPDNEVGTSLIKFANSDGHQLPCLLMSADEFGLQMKADAPAFEFLRKPLQTNELRGALERLLASTSET
jgi:signal transduction histidine kinase/ActR/RegA family two-component response regulator